MFCQHLVSAVCVLLLGMIAGCSASDLVGDPTAQGTSENSPDAVKSEEGALQLYDGVLWLQATSTPYFVLESGMLADELRAKETSPISGVSLDGRLLPEGEAGAPASYEYLQRTRANTRQARGVLAEYAPAAPKALTGHLYAVEAMADVMLADLYCSGVPLSTLDPDGGFTLRSGSSTLEVYRTAVALFDSALTLASDSVQILNFARVGKGRALLALGEYDAAAHAVVDVPTEYVYQIEPPYLEDNGNPIALPRTSSGAPDLSGANKLMGNGEGTNGIRFASNGDPRSPALPFAPSGITLYYVPAKYPAQNTPVTLASGVEARLIEAEADLRKHGSAWLTILNALRTDSTYTVTGSDTLWNPGTGGVARLSPLEDPGSESARLDLLFVERAEWLYLTGHRQGDLRRRVRSDHLLQQTVYPTGPYPSGGFYGSDTNVPVPISERQYNSKFAGCLSRGA